LRESYDDSSTSARGRQGSKLVHETLPQGFSDKPALPREGEKDFEDEEAEEQIGWEEKDEL
jgi:hypothetical protein